MKHESVTIMLIKEIRQFGEEFRTVFVDKQEDKKYEMSVL